MIGKGLKRKCMLVLALLWSIAMQATEVFVEFSHQGGFYEKPFHVTLTCPKGYTIHYTVNGNEPTFADAQYGKPLFLDQALYSRSDIYTVQCCPDENWYVPDSIHHCIVIRAAAFDETGACCGDVTTNSYIIKSLGNDFHGLPVVSICSDSLSLFSADSGIFVQGATGNNYAQRGRDWERICNFEFYETGSQGCNGRVGMRTHGAAARSGMQKGMKFYARREYSNSKLSYPFFGSDNNDSFKHLILKPFWGEFYRDHVCTEIAKVLDMEVPASRPVVVFLNGEYWGLYFLKERPDARYIADHFGCNKNEVNVIESWFGDVTNGTSDSFQMMMEWMRQANLANDAEYQRARQMIDVDCFIDYYCFQMFVNNQDWPDNNMRCWQANDGKWRWIFFDGDYCLTSYRGVYYKTIGNENDKEASHLLLARLLDNENFRNQFYQRFATLLTHEFHSKRTQKIFKSCLRSIEEEIPAQYHRFGLEDYREQFDLQADFLSDFLDIRFVSAASMLYKLFYYNNWEYTDSKSEKNVRFYEINGKRPTFMIRMARQLKDWQYVWAYFRYERFRIKNEIKELWIKVKAVF